MQRTQTIWIVNGNADTYEDRFDGDDYVFMHGQAVEVPVEGANLMFGYGEPDKKSTLMRAGKAPSASDLKHGMVWLSNFSFHNTEPKEHHLAPVLEVTPEGSGEQLPSSGAANPAGESPKKNRIPA
jgi:hypothetical protein